MSKKNEPDTHGEMYISFLLQRILQICQEKQTPYITLMGLEHGRSKTVHLFHFYLTLAPQYLTEVFNLVYTTHKVTKNEVSQLHRQALADRVKIKRCQPNALIDNAESVKTMLYVLRKLKPSALYFADNKHLEIKDVLEKVRKINPGQERSFKDFLPNPWDGGPYIWEKKPYRMEVAC